MLPQRVGEHAPDVPLHLRATQREVGGRDCLDPLRVDDRALCVVTPPGSPCQWRVPCRSPLPSASRTPAPLPLPATMSTHTSKAPLTARSSALVGAVRFTNSGRMASGTPLFPMSLRNANTNGT
jgi:hypothetical protein